MSQLVDHAFEASEGKRTATRKRLHVPISAAFLFSACFLAWLYSDEVSVLYWVRQARLTTDRGEQMWADEATGMLRVAEARASDKHWFAERLLREDQPSLVAEGMLMAVRHHHPAARRILEEHLGDERGNQFLMTNGALASDGLRVLEIQRRTPTDDEERDLLRWWMYPEGH